MFETVINCYIRTTLRMNQTKKQRVQFLQKSRTPDLKIQKQISPSTNMNASVAKTKNNKIAEENIRKE